MKSVIYYPYFEVQDENWLKFASLYVGKLSTIIPDEGRGYVSKTFEELITEGSFVNVVSSTNAVKHEAATIAISQTESLLKNGSLFSLENNRRNITINEMQNYEIFSQKYPGKRLDFCVKNKLGHKTNNGVKVSKEIAYIYMYALAKLIGDEQDFSPITDNSKGQEFISSLHPEKRGIELQEQNKESFAKDIITLKLPSKLEQIPIKEFIELRNDEAFKKNQEAFHETLDLYIKTHNNDYKSQYLDYVNHMELDIRRWLTPSIATVGTTVIYYIGGENVTSFLPAFIGSFGPILSPDPGPSELNIRKKSTQKFLTDIKNLEQN